MTPKLHFCHLGLQSAADTGRKVIWTVLVLLLPVLGFLLWYFLGPKTGRA